MKPVRLLLSVAAASMFMLMQNVSAATPLDITLNGSYIKTDSYGFIEEGSAMVPVRGISEVFGCDSVSWNGNQKKAEVKYKGKSLELYSGSKNAEVNNSSVKMPQEAVIVDGRMYASVRFLSDFFGADVKWNELTHTVELTKSDHEVKKEHIDNSYTSKDLEWLAKIVHAEAQGEPDNGKIGVANVVINRRDSDQFPNTVYDVVFDTKYGVQFTPVANGAIYNTPKKESYHAAKKALFGKNVVGKSLYFCNLSISTNLWIPNNRTFFTRIGKHSFYL